MRRFEQFFKRCPVLYSILRRLHLFFALRYISFSAYRNRNRLGELWAKGHFDKGSNTIERNWHSRDHPHRSFLVQRIAGLAPASSILEIGCNTGPNLYLLAKKFPDAGIRGIDINPEAVQMGNDWLGQEGVLNVSLSVGRAEELGEFQDKSFDVVFTDAVLIYVNRDKILGVIKEMLRIARKGLILLERHDFEQQFNDMRGLGVYTNGLWVRDYVALLKQFAPAEQIRVTKITEDIWPDEDGKNLEL